MAGSLLRELRGNDSGRTSSAGSSAATTRARRGRATSQSKRTAARGSAKPQPKRTAPRTRTKAQPKRTAAHRGGQARPRRTARQRPLDDVTIARDVESTIFRDVEVDRSNVDVNVADGVVRLRGEVQTPDLINELEARASRVAQVRRVENLLRTPAPPPETAPPTARETDRASTLPETSGPPEQAARPPEGPAEPASGRAEGPPEEAAKGPEAHESADRDELDGPLPQGADSPGPAPAPPRS